MAIGFGLGQSSVLFCKNNNFGANSLVSIRNLNIQSSDKQNYLDDAYSCLIKGTVIFIKNSIGYFINLDNIVGMQAENFTILMWSGDTFLNNTFFFQSILTLGRSELMNINSSGRGVIISGKFYSMCSTYGKNKLCKNYHLNIDYYINIGLNISSSENCSFYGLETSGDIFVSNSSLRCYYYCFFDMMENLYFRVYLCFLYKYC